MTTVRVRDKDEAEERIGHLFLPNRIELVGDAALDLRLDAMRVGSATVARLSYGADVRLTTADAANYHVNLLLAGQAISRAPRRPTTVAHPGGGAAFVPGRPADILWLEGCAQLCLMIPKATLEGELEQLIGTTIRTPLTLDAEMDLSSPIGSSWRESLKVVVSDFDNGPGLASHPVAGRQLERVIIDGLLLGHRHNYTDLLLDAGARATSRTTRLARALVEEQPEAAWSTSRLASRLHVSVRTLQYAFATEVGIPPMAYLRRVRLRRAYEALSGSGPDGTTVAAVAAGLGFTHLGRFAAAYRHLFGEAPSDTLNRT